MKKPASDKARALRVAFAGTPEFAARALQGLLDAGLSVVLVLSRPDRPAGRGQKLQASPVKRFALERGLVLSQPRGLRPDGNDTDDARRARQALAKAAPDVLVVAAYGLILPEWVLHLPRLGCLNIHASLLPRWRGAAPIQRAIEAGDAGTGITIMQMDAGLDTGDMLLERSLPIGAGETAASLHDKLAELGAAMIVEALEQAAHGTLQPRPQPAHGATYAPKIGKDEARIDWSQDAAQIERRLRAFDPFPGASFMCDGQAIKCWRAEVVPAEGPPGTVLSIDARGPLVACGRQALRLLVLQRPGGRRAPAAQVFEAAAVPVGASLGASLDAPSVA